MKHKIKELRWVRHLAFNLALAGAALFGTTGCEVYDSIATTAFMISPEQEVQLGKQVAQQIESSMTIVQDPMVVNYVRKVGQRVVDSAPEKSIFPTRFHVVDNKEINAFAIPGGDIYVHTGLVYAAADEAELAAVLAHEYGHAVYRHGAQHLARQMGIETISGIALGTEAGALAQIGAGLFAQGAITKYSRSDELESDRISVPTLRRAQYDPSGMVSFFETLQERYGDRGGGVMTYFASHPATGERIERISEQIRLEGAQGGGSRPVNELRQVQVRIEQLGLATK